MSELTVKSDIGTDLLAVAYLKMKTEGLLSALFWETAPELPGFLNWCNAKDAVVVGCFSGVNLAGLGAVTGIKKRGERLLGDVSEVFFREYQIYGMTETFGRMLLKFAFEQVKLTDIYGITPSLNIPALRFMRHMGFEHSVGIPNLCVWQGANCSGVISWLSRETWESKIDSQVAAEVSSV